MYRIVAKMHCFLGLLTDQRRGFHILVGGAMVAKKLYLITKNQPKSKISRFVYFPLTQ